MVKYECIRCEYETDQKSKMRMHIHRKIPCSPEKCDLNLVDYEDDILNKNESKQSLFDKIKKLEDEILFLKNENIQLKNQSKILPIKPTQTGANINNGTQHINKQTNTTNYITISLTPYNDPNMEGMEKYLEDAIRKTFLSVPNLIESVHFNKEYPENQNICITNKRTKDAKVFDGKKWKTINKDLLINEMSDTYERELANHAEEKGNIRYLKEYERAKKRGDAEKDLKEEVHNVIYDNSSTINTKITKVEKLVDGTNDKKSESETESESESESESDQES
jgi:hypothetical protein